MEIRFISTLTADDEGQIAPALMNAVTALLDALPIAYTLRVETLGSQVFQHTHPSATVVFETPAVSSFGDHPLDLLTPRVTRS